MKFEFAFETLLDYKHSLEDLARREWTEAQRLVDAAMSELEGFYNQVDESRRRVRTLESQGGTHAPALGAIDEFISGQKIRIEKQRTKIRELMMVAEEKHEILLEAAKERRTLEKLKEKKIEEHKLLQRKHDAKQLDELVVTRFKKADGAGTL